MLIKPDYIVEKLEDIDFESLKSDGKSVLIFDLDSTVMPSKSGNYLPQTKELLDKLQKDFTIVVLSNNTNQSYIDKVREISNFEVISHARKPDTTILLEYLNRIGKTAKDAVMIGDRPLTDILCGKKACVTTILVDSITKDSEHKTVRFVRWLERLTIKYPSKKKNSKNHKICFVICLIFIFCAELIAYLNQLALEIRENMVKIPYSWPIEKFEENYKMAYKIDFGRVYGLSGKKPSIALFGDSCAYGDLQEEKDRLAVNLALYTDRPVYNRAFMGWSIQNFYYQLTRADFYEEVPEPEYAFFFYAPPQFKNMYSPNIYNNLKYRVIEGKLVRAGIFEHKLNKSYFINKMNDIIAAYKSKNFDKSFDDYKVYLIEGKKEADKHWKNTKWVIIKYMDEQDSDNLEKWKELENSGFQIVEMRELLGKNYTQNKKYFMSPHDSHPTPQVWKDVIPLLAKRFKL